MEESERGRLRKDEVMKMGRVVRTKNIQASQSADLARMIFMVELIVSDCVE